MKCLLAAFLLVAAQTATAGHGLMNSFGGIAWLPIVQTLPDSPRYRLESWRDALRLRIESSPAEVFSLAIAQSRHRLAVAEAAARAERKTLVGRALADWGDCVSAAESAVLQLPVGEQEPARRRLANELLEQQYIVATDYMDLPRSVRVSLQAFFEAASERYAKLTAALPRTTRESLFFREEEIRWARQQTLAADEQGL